MAYAYQGNVPVGAKVIELLFWAVVAVYVIWRLRQVIGNASQ